MSVRSIHQIMPAFTYGDAVGNHIARCKRPIPQWRPNDDEEYWCFGQGLRQPELRICIGNEKPYPGELWAKATNLKEIHWNREQFLARGDYLEVQ